MPKSWYSCESLWTFSYPKIVFILRYMSLMEEGSYPPDPRETGYTDFGIRVQHSTDPNAYFVKPVEVVAELKIRLDMCGLDGEIIRRIYTDDVDISVIAKELNEDYGQIWWRINKVMEFCKGTDRRTLNYLEWIKKEKKYALSTNS